MNKKYYSLEEAAELSNLEAKQLLHWISVNSHPVFIYHSAYGDWYHHIHSEAFKLRSNAFAEGFFRVPPGDLLRADTTGKFSPIPSLVVSTTWNSPKVMVEHNGEERQLISEQVGTYDTSSDGYFTSFRLNKPIKPEISDLVIFELPRSLTPPQKPADEDHLNHDSNLQDIANQIAKSLLNKPGIQGITKGIVANEIKKQHPDKAKDLSVETIERRIRVTWK